MKIAIGADHRGLRLKNHIKNYLKQKSHEVEDFGSFSKDSVDYPDIGFPVAEAVSRGDYERGILVCGSGIGITIVADKVKGILAALCHTEHAAEMARRHLNANVLTLGGDVTRTKQAIRIVNRFLETDFEGDRHQRRLEKIFDFEQGKTINDSQAGKAQ